jgi:hypothetical protein
VAGKEIAVKKYVVKLSAEERDRLEALIHAGKSPAQLPTRARILLKADASDMEEGGATARSRRRWRRASTISVGVGDSLLRMGSRRR